MDAIACLVTGRTRAAIATIELNGIDAARVMAKNFAAVSSRPIIKGAVRFGDWKAQNDEEARNEHLTNDTPSESVVVACTDADHWEIHCHGGEVAAHRILDDLVACGVTTVDQPTWLRRTSHDRLRQEALETLIRTVTQRTTAIAMDQVRGAMSNFVLASKQELLSGDARAARSVQERAIEILRFASIGLHLTKPWSVVLAGAPNVGKSSLINALVGYQRSITLDQPGTTRDVLHADAVIDGWPIRLTDTAGIRAAFGDDIEREGIERAEATVRQADVVLWVRDQTDSGPESAVLMNLAEHQVIEIINKSDLLPPGDLNESDPNRIYTSATLGTGIQELRQAIIGRLIPDLPLPGSPIPTCDRQVRGLQRIGESGDVKEVITVIDQML
jgi:tRNA modification GTPase